MAVRPYYVSCLIDGRKTDLKGGPKSLTGGMRACVTVRGDAGEILTPIVLDMPAATSGRVVLVKFSKLDRTLYWSVYTKHWASMFHAPEVNDRTRTIALVTAVKEIGQYANETGLDAPAILEAGLKALLDG